MKKKSFTLIELILVLFILSSLSLVGVFRLGAISKMGFNNEIENFKNDYSFARQASMSSGYGYQIKFDDESYIVKSKASETFDIKRELNYIRPLKKDLVINLKSNGYVSSKNTAGAYTIIFVGKNNETRMLTIGAIGGYLRDEKD